MSSYVVFSLIAAVGFTAAGIVNKFASKYAITEKWPLLFWYYFTFIPFALLIPLMAPITTPATVELWLLIFGYSVCFLLGNICFFTAVFKVDASVFSPFFQLQAAFLALLAFLFLGERFPLSNYLWMGVILAGAVLVAVDERMSVRSFFSKAILLILAMQFFHAGSNLFAGLVLRFTDFWNLTWWSTLVSTVLVLLFTAAVNGLRVRVSTKQLRPMFIVNALSFVAALSLFRAFQENVTISGILSLLTGPLTFLVVVALSRWKPEFLEHHPAKVYIVRGAGVILTLAGAILVSV